MDLPYIEQILQREADWWVFFVLSCDITSHSLRLALYSLRSCEVPVYIEWVLGLQVCTTKSTLGVAEDQTVDLKYITS